MTGVAAVREVRRYLAIAGQFARIGVIRKSQFRVEFFTQVVMDCVWYATHVGIFEILFAHAESIAGWRKEEIRVFLGFLFVSDAFMMMWLGQQWRFGRDLKDGKLDPVRVRPAAGVFLYFFQQFSLEATVNMAVAVGYLTFGLSRAGLTLGPELLIVLPWSVGLACWARFVVSVLFSLWEFYLLHSDVGRMLDHAFGSATDRPLDIFPRRVKLFFLYLVPVGVMTHAPASLVLGRQGALEGLFHTAWMLGLGIAVLRLWSHGFRRYESAMS